jgi:hypothetical protein
MQKSLPDCGQITWLFSIESIHWPEIRETESRMPWGHPPLEGLALSPSRLWPASGLCIVQAFLAETISESGYNACRFVRSNKEFGENASLLGGMSDATGLRSLKALVSSLEDRKHT